MKAYIAAPIVNIPDDWKNKINTVVELVSCCFDEVYNPAKHGVPNAWGMTSQEWMRCIFVLDCVAIDDSDWVIVCDFGRSMTAGTAWEAGYAFGKGKKILTIRMSDDKTDYSVMVNGCSSNNITYTDFVNASGSKLENNIFVEIGRVQSETVYN